MKAATIIAVTGSLLLFPALSKAQYQYLDITNPFLRKIPIAIPIYRGIADTETERQTGKECTDLTADSLNFTGFFKILDREAFLVHPRQVSLIGPGINFKNWSAIGAELLITGGITLNDNSFVIELRLFDTFQEKLLVGKRYKGGLDQKREIIRRFCSEVVFYLTGNKGIFDSKIAFVSNGSGNKEIYICDFDGFSPRAYTKHNSITLFPAWSWDGQWLAYTSFKRGKPDLYVRNLDRNLGTVVSRMGLNSFACWRPGAFEFAATLSFSGDQEIYLLTGKGKIIKQLTHNLGIDVSPSFSPDGKQMAFVSRRAGTPQIFIMDMETLQVRRLTYSGRYNTQPSWSPLGDRIAYSSMKNGEIDIHVIGTDGRGDMQLTQNEGYNESPSWSPDGSLIAFSSNREGPSRIYVMTAYGTDQRRLLTLPGEQSNPKWSPNISKH